MSLRKAPHCRCPRLRHPIAYEIIEKKSNLLNNNADSSLKMQIKNWNLPDVFHWFCNQRLMRTGECVLFKFWLKDFVKLLEVDVLTLGNFQVSFSYKDDNAQEYDSDQIFYIMLLLLLPE